MGRRASPYRYRDPKPSPVSGAVWIEMKSGVYVLQSSEHGVLGRVTKIPRRSGTRAQGWEVHSTSLNRAVVTLTRHEAFKKLERLELYRERQAARRAVSEIGRYLHAVFRQGSAALAKRGAPRPAEPAPEDSAAWDYDPRVAPGQDNRYDARGVYSAIQSPLGLRARGGSKAGGAIPHHLVQGPKGRRQ